jgi:hypothetical protein
MNRLELGGTDQYIVLTNVQVGVGDPTLYIGSAGRCRFCGTDNAKHFRKIAHTIPESLGNKWVISRDECDDCNTRSSQYEDALAKAVGPFLTLGGTRGKGNHVRQTGRSKGGSVVAHRDGTERRELHFSARGISLDEVLRLDHTNGIVKLVMPVAGVPFAPRLAYKALLKMAVLLLPDAELDQFATARQSLLDPSALFPEPPLEVVASFGSIGNAPPLVAMCLLRRRAAEAALPSTIFILCAGSVCLRIWVFSDAWDAHVPRYPLTSMNLPWRVVLNPPGVDPVVIEYLHQKGFDWTSEKQTPQPVQAMHLDFHLATRKGVFTPIFREPAT